MLRKKTDPALRLDSVVSMKMTLAERTQWDQKATEAGMTASALLRAVVLENRTTVQARPKTDHEMVRFLHLYLLLVNRVETVLTAAISSMAIGDLSARDLQTLVFRLDEVVQIFRKEFRHVD